MTSSTDSWNEDTAENIHDIKSPYPSGKKIMTMTLSHHYHHHHHHHYHHHHHDHRHHHHHHQQQQHQNRKTRCQFCVSRITHTAVQPISKKSLLHSKSSGLFSSPSSSSSSSSSSVSSFFSFGLLSRIILSSFSFLLPPPSSSSPSSTTHMLSRSVKRNPITWLLLVPLLMAPVALGQERDTCGFFKHVHDWENPMDGACGSRDIRDKVENLKYLENCTVIEGDLRISVIGYAPQEEYDRYSFPELREITGHMMLYRVFGLGTLRRMFPNLAVIRGQNLFYDYALAVIEMPDLEELGLLSLTSILNGAVRLVKNNRLCYVDTVDWKRVATGVDPSEHFIRDNRESRSCPDACHSGCVTTKYDEVTRPRCWGYKPNDCQRNLDCKCSNKQQPCRSDGSCCHRYCIGGCTGPTDSDCVACRGVLIKGKCRPLCPTETYMHANRRCLYDKQCLDLVQTSPHSVLMGEVVQHKLLVGTGGQPSLCVEKCPEGYTVDNTTVLQCVRCKGICPKVCNSTTIQNLKDSEKMYGCSKIEGHLEIQIRGGKNIDTVLTRNLGAIQEVTDYIKVMSSHALRTLHFFQSLEVIGGEKLVHKFYSLVVVDNTNLQEIFPKDQIPKMSIRHGRVSFHYNRKLCFKKIANFTKTMGMKPRYNSHGINIDTNNETNGDLTPCEDMLLSIKVEKVGSTHMLISWTKYTTRDDRHLRNYKIFYKSTDEEITDIFKGRDACSEMEWQQKDHEPSGTSKEYSFIPSLKPFTRYAVYVQAFTLSTATKSAMTPIVYPVTKPSKPTEPLDLKVTSPDPHELLVHWKPPKNPNGIVTHYKVFYTLQVFDLENFRQRDYCINPNIDTRELYRRRAEQRLRKEQKKRDNCCDCPTTEEEKLAADRIESMDRHFQDSLLFENNLHAKLFQKRWGKECNDLVINFTKVNRSIILFKDKSDQNDTESQKARKKAMSKINAKGKDETVDDNDELNPDNNDTLPTQETNPTQEVIVYDTKVLLTDMEHFQDYSIEVVACHETDQNGHKLCGDNKYIAFTTAKTKAYKQGEVWDGINASLIDVGAHPSKPNDVTIKWPSPEKSNGPILKYNIKYKRVSEASDKQVCISRQHYYNNSGGFVLPDLLHGNYSFQINAVSLAGSGTYTREIYYYIAAPEGTEEDSTSTLATIVGIVVGVVIFTAIVAFCVLKAMILKDTSLLLVSPNPNYLNTDTYDIDEWEVDREKIRLLHEVGKGSFGLVYEGVMEDEKKDTKCVAVKTVNDTADFHERLRILKEATTMKVFECHHVVKLLGVVSQGQPALVIMEYMALGDLRGYLRKCRLEEVDYPDFHPPTANQIRQMAGEIADGMAYLANKRIVHRDLAARNCLVAEDITVKIADFGMARDIYLSEYYRKDQRALLPIRWMAPESLQYGVFTTMSDVWSYGVVLWEMISLAEQPYQGLSNEEVLRFVTAGQKMPKPTGCPKDLYDMMRRCWAYKPKDRPTFKFLIEKVLHYLSPRFKEVSFFSQELICSDSENEEDKDEMSDCAGAMASRYHDDEGEGEDDYHGRIDDNDLEDNNDDDNGDNDDHMDDANECGKWIHGISDGGSSGFCANSSGDEDPSPSSCSQGNNTPTSALACSLTPPTRIGGFPVSSRSPHSQHHHSQNSAAAPSFPQLPPPVSGWKGSKGEHSPLLLEQGGVQQPLLFPPSPTVDQNNMGSYPSSHDEEDNDDLDDDNTRNNKNDLFIDDTDDDYDTYNPSHSLMDSRMSEHSKLLPQSNILPRSNIPNKLSMPHHPSSNSNNNNTNNNNNKNNRSNRHRNNDDDDDDNSYSIMSHPTAASSSRAPSKVSTASPKRMPNPSSVSYPGISAFPQQQSYSKDNPLQSPPLSSSSSSKPSPSSNTPPSLSQLQNHILHKTIPPPSDKLRNSTTKHNAVRSGLNNPRHHKNSLVDRSPDSSNGSEDLPLTPSSVDGDSDTITNCKSSGSGGGSGSGSKESSSSTGSHQRFNPGTANGHGPFSHQQAAFC